MVGKMSDPIDFWYEFGSTYSYLSVMRIEAVAQAAGADVRWRPFLLGPIFAEQGWDDSPFNIYPTKGRYMWRDLERLCEDYELDFKRPSIFPRNGLMAARVACIASDEGWCADFTRAVFTANFAQDRDIADVDVLADILSDVGRDPAAIMEAPRATTNKERLRCQTEESSVHPASRSAKSSSGATTVWARPSPGLWVCANIWARLDTLETERFTRKYDRKTTQPGARSAWLRLRTRSFSTSFAQNVL